MHLYKDIEERIMKVIFLDIDGVLNSKQWNESHQKEIEGGKLIDSTTVRLLAEIVQQTGSLIILHSGWRFWLDESLQAIRKESENLLNLLEENGLSIYAMTPDLTTEEIRRTKEFGRVKAKEILLWLEQNENVESWIVLEDLDLLNDRVRNRQVQTNSEYGMTQEDVEIAIKMLNGDYSKYQER